MSPLGVQTIKELRVKPEHKRDLREYDRQLNRIISIFQKQIEKDLTQGDLLDTLDPLHDTLPYLFTLYSHVIAATWNKGVPNTLRPRGRLWFKLATFLTECDPVEIRYGGSMWTELVEQLGETSQYDPVDGQVGGFGESQ